MTTPRETILQHLHRRLRSVLPARGWDSPRTFPDLTARFAQTLQAVKGEVYQVGSWSQALARVSELLDALAATRVVVNPDPPLDQVAWSKRWPERSWFVVGQTSGSLREFCARADVGISGAMAALAETGSIVVGSGPSHSRMATLLPPVHIALVATTVLVPDLFAWIRTRPHSMPAALTIISGPSKSADIEQTLAVGVHGPRRFIVVLYDDEHASGTGGARDAR